MEEQPTLGTETLRPSATTLTAAITATTSVIVNNIFVCNTDTTSGTFRISIARAGAADDISQYWFYDQTIAAKTTTIYDVSWLLLNTDVVRVYSSSGNINFNFVTST